MSVSKMKSLIEKIKMLSLTVKHAHWDLILNEIRHRIYSDVLHYSLRRDLSLPFKVPEPNISVKIRLLQHDDITKLLNTNEQKISGQEFKDRMVRLSMVKANISTCYVATCKNDTPCHMLWWIGPGENNSIQAYFNGGFPKLAPDEVLIEGLYTYSAYRGQGIMPYAISLVAEYNTNSRTRWATALVRDNNIPSLKAMKRAGFKPYILRKVRWRLFRREVSFISLTQGSPYALDPQ